MSKELDDAFERMKTKGGTFHGSIKYGCVVHVNGEKPITLVEPRPDYEPPNKKQDVIYL